MLTQECGPRIRPKSVDPGVWAQEQGPRGMDPGLYLRVWIRPKSVDPRVWTQEHGPRSVDLGPRTMDLTIYKEP